MKLMAGGGKIDFAFLRPFGTNFVPQLVSDLLASCEDNTVKFALHTGITSELI